MTLADILNRHLEWRTLIPHTAAGFMEPGAELCGGVVPGLRSRWALYEVRTGGFPGRKLRLRDAQVDDAKAPAVVWEGETLEEAAAFLEGELRADQAAEWAFREYCARITRGEAA